MKSILFLSLLGICCYTSQAQQPSFAEQFPRLTPGNPLEAQEQPLVRNADTEPFFCTIDGWSGYWTPEEIAQGAVHRIYPVGKIPNYRGTDLYIFDTEFTRPAEDSYDNHESSLRHLAFVRNGRLQTTDDGEMLQLIGLRYQYIGEGGTAFHDTLIDRDTQLLWTTESSEQESATGFQTPIVTSEQVRRRLLPDEGSTELLEVLGVEFSSPFFETDKVAELLLRCKKTGYIDYPTHNQPQPLSFSAQEEVQSGVFLRFYLTDKEGKPRTVFTTHGRNEQLIDSYTLGSQSLRSQSDQTAPKQQPAADTTASKWPTIISTSDGKLHLLPDGRFHLEKN